MEPVQGKVITSSGGPGEEEQASSWPGLFRQQAPLHHHTHAQSSTHEEASQRELSYHISVESLSMPASAPSARSWLAKKESPSSSEAIIAQRSRGIQLIVHDRNYRGMITPSSQEAESLHAPPEPSTRRHESQSPVARVHASGG